MTDAGEDRLYTQEHLWITHDESLATIGVARYIAEQVGVPLHYALPAPGTRIVRGEVFAEIEAGKTMCEITAPVTGTVAVVNPDLEREPAALVDHPHDMWLVKVSDASAADIGSLLSADQYRRYLKGSNVVHPLRRRFSAPFD